MSALNELFPELVSNPVGWSSTRPAQFLSAASSAFDPLTAARLPGASRPLLQSELAGAADFSQQQLRAYVRAGIPGLQYKDEGSRQLSWRQEPLATRNMVVFSPERLEILRRARMGLGPVSAGVASNMLLGEDAHAR